MKIKKYSKYRACFYEGTERKLFNIVADGPFEALRVAWSAGAGLRFDSLDCTDEEVYLADC